VDKKSTGKIDRSIIQGDQARKILEADLKNIVSKVASGKTLSARERKVIEEATSEKDEAESVGDLIEILGMTRSNFYKYKKRKGSPDGNSISQWKKFIAESQLAGETEQITPEEIVQLKAKLLKEKAFREEIERKLKEIRLDREAQGFVPLSQAKEAITRVLEPISRILEGIPKKYALRVNPSDPDHAEEMLREMVQELKTQVQDTRAPKISKQKGIK